jgi:Putative serine esterase (DUF676)
MKLSSSSSSTVSYPSVSGSDQYTSHNQTRSTTTSSLRNNHKFYSSIAWITVVIASLAIFIAIIPLGVVLTLSQPVHSSIQQQPSSRIPWFRKMLSPTNDDDIMTETVTAAATTTTTSAETTTVTPSDQICIQFDQNKTGNVHIIILVHGIFGNSKELNYLEKMINETSTQSNDHWVIHSVTSNVGLTLDGIEAGGKRIASEVNEYVTTVRSEYAKLNYKGNNKKISLSIVGHSLGGLYSRYAISEIDFTNVIPAVFCTVVCPHLGVSDYTYIKIPRFAEAVVATGLKQTGSDLFRYTTLLDDMITQEKFIQPLQNFNHRRAYANAYNTDFQVPFRTSAFLSETDSVHHFRATITNETTTDNDENVNKFVALVVETEKRSLDEISSKTRVSVSIDETGATGDVLAVQPGSLSAVNKQQLTGDEIATRLDSFGWTKIFCDMRETVTSVPKPVSLFQTMSQMSTQCYNILQQSTSTITKAAFSSTNSEKVVSSSSEDLTARQPDSSKSSTENASEQQIKTAEKSSYTSSELIQQYSSCKDRWHLPYGHSTIVANSKAEWYAELNAAGRPMVKRIAQDLMKVIPQVSNI